LIKVKYEGLMQKLKKLEQLKKLMSTPDGKDILNKLSKKAADIIYKRVKSGKGVSSNSQNAVEVSFASMKDFSPAYLRRRKLHPPTGAFSSPAKQNLTYTGQMLDAIVNEVTRNGFKIFINKTSREGSKLNNNKVAEYVSELRPFLALTVKEQALIKREFINLVRQLAKKIFS